MAQRIIGSVAELWRFPVKSMRGEKLQEAAITERGMLGDRAYALIDTDTGRVVSAKSAKLFPDILNCKAKFVDPPQMGRKIPPVQISLPDGTVLRSDAAIVDRALSTYLNRNVALRQSAPEDFTVDQYHPDVEGADPGGNRDTVVAQKLGSALFASLGMESPLPIGSFLDVFPISILTSSTLARLTELQPQSRFDLRRFRMNVILKTESTGFIENDWIGHTLHIGKAAQLSVALLDPRCVMVTLAQDDLPKDTEVLRALVRHNRAKLGDLGEFPCAGSYAVVATPGSVRVVDQVVLN
jgi:MOSC domain-containing protein